jgi:hypothetical protein
MLKEGESESEGGGRAFPWLVGHLRAGADGVLLVAYLQHGGGFLVLDRADGGHGEGDEGEDLGGGSANGSVEGDSLGGFVSCCCWL